VISAGGRGLKKVGIVSDTHWQAADGPLPPEIFEALKGVDLILHAGDLVDLEIIDRLSEIAPVQAVAGNMDSAEVRQQLPKKRILDIEKIRLGLIHGWGPPWDLAHKVMEEFPEDVKVVVFGHSHQPSKEWIDGRLLFNPGSLLKDRFSKGRSYGLLTVQDDRVEAELHTWQSSVDP
jgi:putative phosphoesterase